MKENIFFFSYVLFLCRVSHKRACACAWYVRACSVHMRHDVSRFAPAPPLVIARRACRRGTLWYSYLAKRLPRRRALENGHYI